MEAFIASLFSPANLAHTARSTAQRQSLAGVAIFLWKQGQRYRNILTDTSHVKELLELQKLLNTKIQVTLSTRFRGCHK
jgi:hypothetical protein